MAYLYLAIAIVAEVVGTSALKDTNGFTRLWPSVLVVNGYGVAFFCLGKVLDTMNVGIAYAIWAGLGIVLVAAVSAVKDKVIPDLAAVVGMSLIVAGVVIVNVFSHTVKH